MYQLSLKLGCTQGTAELPGGNYNFSQFLPHPTPLHSFSPPTSIPPTSSFISAVICSYTAPASKKLKPPREGNSGGVRCLPWGLSITTTAGTKPRGAVTPGGSGGKAELCSSLRGSAAPTQSQNPETTESSGWKSPPRSSNPTFTHQTTSKSAS